MSTTNQRQPGAKGTPDDSAVPAQKVAAYARGVLAIWGMR